MATQLSWQLIFLAILFCLSNIEANSMQMERIVGGFNATAKQFPYQVHLKLYKSMRLSSSCGGTIISEKHILTAAHCLVGELLAIEITFGAVDISISREAAQQRLVVYPNNIVIHNEYDENQYINDIALIKLPAELQFDEYIQPAQLPDPEEVYYNEMTVVSGWGTIEVLNNGYRIKTNVLQYYNVNIMSNEKGKVLLHQRTPLQFVPTSWICLEPSSSNVCFGDSGGPLAVNNMDGSSTILGIASFVTNGLCRVNTPSVYMRVTSYLDWIVEAMLLLE